MIVVRILLLVNFTFYCLFSLLWAQDERAFRHLLMGYDDLQKERELEKKGGAGRPPLWQLDSPSYLFDLDGDSYFEKIQWIIKDGLHYLRISDTKDQTLLEQHLFAIGGEGWPYKIRIARISPKAKVMIVFFHQGYRSYLEPYGQSILYFVSWDNDDLKGLKAIEGPIIWEERERIHHRYRQHFFDVIIKDLNQDGQNEIMVKSNKISRVYFYLGKGKWKAI